MKGFKLLMVILGSILVSLGVSIAVNSGFGVDPITLLWTGISQVLNITLGQASMLTSAIMLAIVLVMDRSQINIGTIVNPFIVGVSTDYFIAHGFRSNNMAVNIALLLIGLICLGVGLGVYTYANFGRGPYEALVLALVNKFNIKLVYVRYMFDLSFLVIGILLGAKLSIGPIVALMIMGYIIQETMKTLGKIGKLRLINEY